MEVLWVASALVVASLGGWPVTTAVLKFARAVDERDHGGTTSAHPDSIPPGVLRGGMVIGLLERVAVAGAILAGEPVAIAYVIAIKGLGRYSELKETPAAAERFIIGTLVSLLWASAAAVATAVYLL